MEMYAPLEMKNTTPHTMKKFLPFLSLLLWSGVSWAQTGTGVVLLTEDSFTFTPTTVDSTTVFNLQLKNTVGVPQTVFFGGLDAPFELSSNLPVELASQDTLDFSIAFPRSRRAFMTPWKSLDPSLGCTCRQWRRIQVI